MRRSRTVQWMAAALLGLLPLAPSASAQTEDALKQAAEKITNYVVPGLGSSLFTSHAKVAPYQIDGKWVYALAIRDEGGSRCTLNFDAKWKDQRRFKAYILGVTPEVRATMQFQRKGDKKMGSDSNRGPTFKHGDTVVLDGGRNYLAQRGFEAGPLLANHPNVCVVFIEEGLSFERFLEAMR